MRAIRRYIERIPAFDPAERAFVKGCDQAVEELGELRELAEAAGASAQDLKVLDSYREAFETGIHKRRNKTLSMSIAEQAGVAGMLGVGGALIFGMSGALSLGTFAAVFFPSGLLMVPGTLKFYKDRAERASLPQAELAKLGRHSLDTVASYQMRAQDMRVAVKARREVEDLHQALTEAKPPRVQKSPDQVRIGGITLKVRRDSRDFDLEVPEEPPPPRGPLG